MLGILYYYQGALKLSIREVVITVMIAACISHWHCCLPRAKMARPVRRCPTPGPQQEGTEEVRTWSWARHSRAKGGRLQCRTCKNRNAQRWDPSPEDDVLEMYMGILWVNKMQEPEIMVLWLQDMFIQLGFSPKAAKLLVREQWLDSPDRIRVLTNKNVDDSVMSWGNQVARMPMGCPTGGNKSQW